MAENTEVSGSGCQNQTIKKASDASNSNAKTVYLKLNAEKTFIK